MNNQVPNDFTKFKDFIADWQRAYKWLVRAYYAVKSGDNVILIYGRQTFEAVKPTAVSNPYFETERILIGYEVTEMTEDQVGVIIGNVENGVLVTNKYKLSLARRQGLLASPNFSTIYPPNVNAGPRLPFISISGESTWNMVSAIARHQELDWEVKAAKHPYNSFAEVLAGYDLPSFSDTRIEIMARAPATISTSSAINAGHATIVCQLASTLEPSKVKLGCEIFQDHMVKRLSVAGETMTWTTKDEIQEGSTSLPVEDASMLQAFLSYAGVALDQAWVSDPQNQPNARRVVHGAIDGDLGVIKDFLSGTAKDKGRDFEIGVSLLFNLLGFSAPNYGGVPRLQDAPDIIAFTETGNIAVIECTTGLLDQEDKLAKLVRRTSQIEKLLSASGHSSVQIQAVIVTSLDEGEVAAHLEEARKNGIAVVCQADLGDLINQTQLAVDGDTVFEYLKRLIPSKGGGFPLGEQLQHF